MSPTATEDTTQAPRRVMRTPQKVEVAVTSRCNLRCRYCYFFDNPAVPYEDLPTDEWLRFFEECGQCAVMDVTLEGGEAFIREDLRQLIQGVVDNRMRFQVLSNGTLIDDAIAEFIAGTGRCNHVQVSVDGSKPETHDACRGPGAFERAIRGIRVLQRHRVPVAVRVTVHRHNVHDLDGIAQLLLEELGLPSFSTNSACYFGSCRVNAEQVMLTAEDRQAAMETLLRLTQKYDDRISAQAGPLAEGRNWAEMEKAQQEAAPAFPGRGHLTACGGVNQKIAVRSDGVMIPCAMLAHMELGRINHDPLAEVWQQSPLLNELRGRRSIPLGQFEHCKGCPYIPYCTGSCPGSAYALTGQVDHPSPDACLRRFLRDGGKLLELD